MTLITVIAAIVFLLAIVAAAEWPALADALAVEVGRGATAADLRRFTVRYTGRVQLAQRIEQAAAHLAAQRQGSAA